MASAGEGISSERDGSNSGRRCFSKQFSSLATQARFVILSEAKNPGIHPRALVLPL
jgi:hypothetical protein